MADQLTQEQIANYERLLDKEKKQREINGDKNTACFVTGGIAGLIGASSAVPISAGVGAPLGFALGFAGGCALGDGAVDVYHRVTGTLNDHAMRTFGNKEGQGR
ncbi:MAG: hypothetical protein ABL867_06250 [Rickettsiales bacterium]